MRFTQKLANLCLTKPILTNGQLVLSCFSMKTHRLHTILLVFIVTTQAYINWRLLQHWVVRSARKVPCPTCFKTHVNCVWTVSEIWTHDKYGTLPKIIKAFGAICFQMGKYWANYSKQLTKNTTGLDKNNEFLLKSRIIPSKSHAQFKLIKENNWICMWNAL